jgi:succinate-semialdehyde dehydrogenase/glutarate-semialdehyde dehydrogenase
MVARKIAPALAAGCTVVLKPAEETPLSALALGALALEAGVPPGVLNVVTGVPSEIGAELTGNRLVRKVTFTGSTAVGKLLAAQSSATVKKLSLELGGNAPFIVFDDADLDAAVEGALKSRFRNSGQTCVAANRLFVQRGIHDRFVAALSERVRALTVGDGTDPDTQLGPLINDAAVAKVNNLLNGAVAKGAQSLMSTETLKNTGAFVSPTVLIGVSDSMAVASDEIFGPIAAVLAFDTEDEVIARANSTPYGLVAYFYTADRRRQVRVAERLEFGMVGINECLVAYEGAPFGGMKESGLGREGSHHGLDDYTELKYLCEGGLG